MEKRKVHRRGVDIERQTGTHKGQEGHCRPRYESLDVLSPGTCQDRLCHVLWTCGTRWLWRLLQSHGSPYQLFRVSLQQLCRDQCRPHGSLLGKSSAGHAHPTPEPPQGQALSPGPGLPVPQPNPLWNGHLPWLTPLAPVPSSLTEPEKHSLARPKVQSKCLPGPVLSTCHSPCAGLSPEAEQD